MKVKEIMTPEPFYCTVEEPVERAARIMKEWDIGSLPVVTDQQTRRIKGIVTDRDLCCSMLLDGKDPKVTAVEEVMTRDPVTCGPEDDVNSCAEIMQEHQVRRVPVLDEQNRCIGIVAQADLALNAKPKQISRIVTEISKPHHEAWRNKEAS